MKNSSLSQSNKPVAFFDFDGTLTNGDSLMPFLKYVVGSLKYYENLVKVSPFLVAYFSKLVRNDVVKQVVLKRYLGGYSFETLLDAGERFSEDVIPNMLRLDGIERLEWHKAQGHECVLVSASLSVYLNSWAKKYGFSHVICSHLDVNHAGFVSGELSGKNCFGFEKVESIRRVMGDLADRETFAYGDSLGDYPMLRMATYGMILDTRFSDVWQDINKI